MDARTYNESRGYSAAQLEAFQLALGVAATGTWTDATLRAIEAFQREQGLEVDGKLGPDTRARLAGPKIVHYGAYSGIRLRGREPVTGWAGYDPSRHLDRTIMLAAQLEAPKWGSVQTYDGCGISGGLLHHTATFPGKSELGGLWALLGAIEHALGGAPILPSVRIVAGVPSHATSGETLDGDAVRELFTGSRAGTTASPIPALALANANAVHQALCKVESRPAQVEAAATFLVQYTGKLSPSGAIEPGHATELRQLAAAAFVSSSKELAFCVVRAFAVNNPRRAKQCFAAAGEPGASDFEAKLYAALAAGWDNRVGNTRDAVVALGLWDAAALAPLQLHLRK